jgi:hypothetical protein
MIEFFGEVFTEIGGRIYPGARDHLDSKPGCPAFDGEIHVVAGLAERLIEGIVGGDLLPAFAAGGIVDHDAGLQIGARAHALGSGGDEALVFLQPLNVAGFGDIAGGEEDPIA